jgi:1-acyl-sn-glycerol-3-phosphate acyltransferase
MDMTLPLAPPSLTSRVRALRRMAAVLAWTVPSLLIQAVCVLLPGRPKVVFAKLYWAVFARLLGLHVRVIGDLASRSSDRPVIFVSNHSSWVDIPVVGGVLDGCFVAKGDVAGWPVVGTIARLGRSVFVTRQRGSTVRERDTMQGLLAGGDNLILFPEGTSSDGSRVLPFRSSFFSVAQSEARPIIQPVSVVYDRLGGLPTGRANRPVFAWYGDMDIASHAWRLSRCAGLRVTVLLHTPIDPARFPNRKAMSQAVWRTVADGAATLRQNRPARPLEVSDVPGDDLVGGADEAFA